MISIVNVKEYNGDIDEAIKYIHGAWGNEENYNFYSDAIKHSSLEKNSLPQFYVMLKDDKIIGCSALITNDLVSRHDLYPWMACLFVNEDERGQNYGNLLMEYAENEAKKAGFSSVYLTTTHDGYYEKYDWKRLKDGYHPWGERVRIYEKEL